MPIMDGIYDIVQESPFGQLVGLLTGNRYFKYPEELPGFEVPWEKAIAGRKEASSAGSPVTGTTEDRVLGADGRPEPDSNAKAEDSDPNSLDRAPTVEAGLNTPGLATTRTTTRTITREQVLPFTAERMEVEQQEIVQRAESAVIIPTETSAGIVVVDWYTTNDPANPFNWSTGKKSWLTFIIFIYTFAVYCASSIYVPSEPGIIRHFNVSQVKASLGLSLYVIGYGVGPLLFSPLSEVPLIGRNMPYIISILLFVILAIPTALVENYAGLLVLRGLTGFMGSPALATGGASMTDIYTLVKLPYGLLAWTAAAFAAPALGPALSGFAVMNENWRWSLWEILWISAPVAIVMLLFMPETSAGNILVRRAQRLRKLTGNPNLRPQSEIDQGNKTFRQVAADALVKPLEITFKDPAVTFVAIYACYIYGIYYSFFEVFPLVYIDIYRFNLGELGLTFISIIIGSMIGVIIYVIYLHYYLEPDIKKHGLRANEHRLVPALFAVTLLPVSLFWFGWTSERSIHWIVCTIGLTLFPLGAFILFQCIFIYLPLTYPKYAASLFAASDFCRSMLAAGAIIFAHPLYINLGVGRGTSLLAGLLCGGCVGIWALYYYGARLRARSKFAVS